MAALNYSVNTVSVNEFAVAFKMNNEKEALLVLEARLDPERKAKHHGVLESMRRFVWKTRE
jgi:hypothetical protein